jgi:hypothetical protein
MYPNKKTLRKPSRYVCGVLFLSCCHTLSNRSNGSSKRPDYGIALNKNKRGGILQDQLEPWNRKLGRKAREMSGGRMRVSYCRALLKNNKKQLNIVQVQIKLHSLFRRFSSHFTVPLSLFLGVKQGCSCGLLDQLGRYCSGFVAYRTSLTGYRKRNLDQSHGHHLAQQSCCQGNDAS